MRQPVVSTWNHGMFRHCAAFTLLCATVFAVLGHGMAQASPRTQDQTWMVGVNLDGGSFGPDGDRLHTDYTYPTTAEIDYYTGKGATVFRIPFLARRMLAADAQGTLTPSGDFAILTELIDYAATKDAKVVLDMHDYGLSRSGKLIGRDPGSVEEFAASWETLARPLKDRPNVIFGLMNEPHKQSATEWLSGANAAAKAIRKAGADQLILVPGSYWDGAHSWTTTDNAEVMLGFEDPADNYVFEVHQYLDFDHSGTHRSVVPGGGSTRLAAFTAWARDHGVKGFLGEFGWADTPEAHREGRDLLCYMARNRDVWFGWTYWAGGPWWGDYMFSVEPRDGKDRPQMKVLSEFMMPDAEPNCD